jgi:hypothetical protein
MSGNQAAEQLKVVSISDCDTSTALDGQYRQAKVRLHD